MSLINKNSPNCGHKLKMVDSYPTYHCDNCGKEYYVKGKKVLLYVLFVTCVSVVVSIVAYSLQDYLTTAFNIDFSNIPTFFLFIGMPVALIVFLFKPKSLKNNLTEKK